MATEFEIVLRRRNISEPLGLTVGEIADKDLMIARIADDGLFAAWNSRQRDKPELQVGLGDCIVRVNGKSNNSTVMLQQLNSELSLRLMVKRSPRKRWGFCSPEALPQDQVLSSHLETLTLLTSRNATRVHPYDPKLAMLEGRQPLLSRTRTRHVA
eukprot:TRINITY_DN52729_c0_g1_i1.p1 TRINITY_DN52729_c0_g1~~TRINITY_DN52729_c0_g1_i1.p1  ORF type:complete len:176 (+),score=12.26 TRINITY_DN52729_c0_g1_i1:61-528(+)